MAGLGPLHFRRSPLPPPLERIVRVLLPQPVAFHCACPLSDHRSPPGSASAFYLSPPIFYPLPHSSSAESPVSCCSQLFRRGFNDSSSAAVEGYEGCCRGNMRPSDSDGYFPRSRGEAQLDCDLYRISETNLSDSSISQLEKAKRRKVCESDLPEFVETTAEYRAQIEIIPVCEESQSEDESEIDPSGVSILSDIADSVNDRLCALQHLLPRGLELEKDEILKVAIDYVKALEREIQMFDNSVQDWSKCSKPEAHNLTFEGSKIAVAGLQTDVGEASVASEGSALQKRGLCVVPLSALAKAF